MGRDDDDDEEHDDEESLRVEIKSKERTRLAADR
jgi:hypothetical protein